MHRNHLISLAVLCAGAAAAPAMAFAQSPKALTPTKIPTAIKHAGIYHVSTGTCTRTGAQTANFGPDTIYSNTASSNYFTNVGSMGGQIPGGTNFDEGALPSSSNPDYPLANRDTYNVNCISIGYCDQNAAGTGGWELGFYGNYAPCTFDDSPDATILATALPANACRFLTLDLSGGAEFALAADQGTGPFGGLAPASFGWSFRYAGTGTNSAGFFLAGDPLTTDPNFLPGGLPTDGTNTYYGPASLCGPGSATGLLTQDLWYVEDPAGANSGCFFFGGYNNTTGVCGAPLNGPYTSYLMELQADLTSPLAGDSYCASNPNSTGVNSTLSLEGSASVAANDVTLRAALPPNSFGFFITSQTQGFTANPAGSQGNICLAGAIGRFVGAGQIRNSGMTGEIELSTSLGDWSLGAIPAPNGPYAAAPGSTTNFQLWHRDLVGTSPTSNLTDARQITWLP